MNVGRMRMLWLGAAVGVLTGTSAQAAELSKCLDRKGQVTYSSERCEAQGLKSAGPIRERTTVIPGVPAAARREPAREGGAKDAAAKDAGGELRGSPVQIKPVNPLVEKLLK